MNEDLLTRNLLALRRSGCPLPEARVLAADDGEVVTRDGRVVGVDLRAPAGRVPMQVSGDPVAEAAAFVPGEAASSALVAVIGAGAGHVIEALVRAGGRGRIVVFEPSLVSCRAALARRDWTPLIDAGRLRWLVGPDYDGWLDTWSWVTPGEAPAVVIHPVLGRVRTPEVRAALETLKKMVFNASANERARRQFGDRYLRHTLANLQPLLASRDVGALFGQCSGMPVAVLAAGPSLDRNLEQLRPVRDRAVVIAVDTALRPCLAAGLPPDLVVGVDPGEVNLRHLAVGTTPARTHLVAEPSLAPGSFEPFEGRVFTFRVGDHDPWPWLCTQGVDRASLRAWGSVLASALDLAVRIGGSPIVLLGADFAYTGGQPYCRNTAYEEDWTRGQAEGYPLDVIWREWIRGAIETTDLAGRPVPTTPHLIAFRDWIANYSRTASDVTIVNGTGAGLLGSLPQVSIDEVLAGRDAIDVPGLLIRVAGSGARGPRPSIAWWDGTAPPQPWTAWAEATGSTVTALVEACGSSMPPQTQLAVLRAAGRLGDGGGLATSESATAEAEYWRQIRSGPAETHAAAARRLVLAPVARTSEPFYSAVCVLLRCGEVAMARACLDDALRADFDGTSRLLLPLLAHACQRADDVSTAHALFGTCERLGLLSARNAWARDAAREVTAAYALRLARLESESLLARALYEEVLSDTTRHEAGTTAVPAQGESLRLPDFIVAGATACGTTFLYDVICASPSVWARRPREIHFFSRLKRYGVPFYSRFFEGCPDGLSCGETSPSYLDTCNPEYAGAVEPDAATAIASTCRSTRVIVILGDPAARAISLYADDRRGSDGAGDRAIDVADLSLEDLQVFRGGGPLVTGKFVLPVRRFAERLGRDRLLILTVADLDDLEALARRLGDFLGIVPPDPATLRGLRWTGGSRVPMPGRLYRELREYYAPTLRALEAEFGVRL